MVAAMKDVGLSSDDISAYMGGNFYRLFQSYTG